ncbi:MAG: recombinase family protein [Pseudomonadota bacterium]
MTKAVRCAIYTRKSTEEGLDQDFNSLDAQREACAAYIASQKHEGWTEIDLRYDDGGFSGGSLDRPALERLLAEVAAGRIDVVVVYKVDRLTRSLADFARIVAIFDAAGVSFVSVTQSFNTTTSMGRLTLNVLLSFAQFEREVTAERIRDKIAASKAKGMWMGGIPPIGYRAQDRKLVVVPEEAALVRQIFDRYLALGSVGALREELAREGRHTPLRVSRTGRRTGGCAFSKGKLYWVLSNPIVVGKVRHRDQVHEGQHEAIVDQETWDRVQAQLATNRRSHANRASARHPSPLAGKLFDPRGQRMRPSHVRKKGKRYRYYVSLGLIEGGAESCPNGWRIPAEEIERALAQAIVERLRDPGTTSALLNRAGTARPDRLITDLHAIARELEEPTQPGGAALLRAIPLRVDLEEEVLRARIDLAKSLQIEQRSEDSPADELEIAVPLRIARRGAAMKLILKGAADDRRPPDPQLVQLLMTARRRAKTYIDPSKLTSISELAAREGIDTGDVSRSMQLAFLAPDLVERILDGRQPPELTATCLQRLNQLPLLWEDQRALLI